MKESIKNVFYGYMELVTSDYEEFKNATDITEEYNKKGVMIND
jgi:hypothetical protein